MEQTLGSAIVYCIKMTFDKIVCRPFRYGMVTLVHCVKVVGTIHILREQQSIEGILNANNAKLVC